MRSSIKTLILRGFAVAEACSGQEQRSKVTSSYTIFPGPAVVFHAASKRADAKGGYAKAGKSTSVIIYLYRGILELCAGLRVSSFGRADSEASGSGSAW